MRMASIGALALALAGGARADVMTLTSQRDTTIWDDPAGQTASGSGWVMIVGRSGGASAFPVRRALLYFDVAAMVPAGATIVSAELVLAHPNGNAGARTVEVHRVIADWGEGASNSPAGQGAPAQTGDATWLHRFYPNAAWAQAGGDFDSSASSLTVVDALGEYTWPSTTLTVADVQGWLDQPATNFGWILKQDDELTPQTTKLFASREADDANVRPRLVIEFTAPGDYRYCQPQIASLGCAPTIGSSGAASASAGSGFIVSLASAVNRKSGFLCYSTRGARQLPFLGGTLCVATPVRRTPVTSSGGNAVVNDCSGGFVLDFNARIAAGVDPTLAAGTVVFAQWLTRDPGNPLGSLNTSDALRFQIGP